MFKVIRSTDIDAEDHYFEINFLVDLTKLKDSIQRRGILNPIWVSAKDNHRYQIISGFRRFYGATAIEMTEIPAVLITEKNKLFTFENIIEENFFHRGYNIIEKAMILSKLKNQFDVPKALIFEKYLPFLGIESSESVYEFYESLLTLDPELQVYVVQNKIPPHVVSDFLPLSIEEQKTILPIVKNLNMTVSMLKEFLNYISDIKVRDRISVPEMLSEPVFTAILDDPQLDLRYKQQRFRKALKLRRFPKLSELETRFVDLKRKVGLPLEASEYFETNRVNLNLSFSNKTEFEKWTQKMNAALDDQNLEELLKIL